MTDPTRVPDGVREQDVRPDARTMLDALRELQVLLNDPKFDDDRSEAQQLLFNLITHETLAAGTRVEPEARPSVVQHAPSSLCPDSKPHPYAHCGLHPSDRVAAEPEAREPDGWRPIETAPKDGSRIVLLGRIGGDVLTARDRVHGCVGFWYDEAAWQRGDSNATPWLMHSGWVFMAPGYTDEMHPTHWMPLPGTPPVPATPAPIQRNDAAFDAAGICKFVNERGNRCMGMAGHRGDCLFDSFTAAAPAPEASDPTRAKCEECVADSIGRTEDGIELCAVHAPREGTL